MNPTVEAIVIAVITAGVPVIIGLVWSAVSKYIASLPQNQRMFVSTIVDDAVRTVEQVSAKLMPGLTMEEKKAEATKVIMEELDHWHITIPAEIISALIEASVGAVTKKTSVAIKQGAAEGGC